MSSQSKATEDGRDPPDADAPAGRRQRARRRDGARTTLRVPTALLLTARRYADDLGTTPNDALIRLAEALLEFETLDSVQIRRVVAGLPLDSDSAPAVKSNQGSSEKEEESTNPFKKPILPPTPATA